MNWVSDNALRAIVLLFVLGLGIPLLLAVAAGVLMGGKSKCGKR